MDEERRLREEKKRQKQEQERLEQQKRIQEQEQRRVQEQVRGSVRPKPLFGFWQILSADTVTDTETTFLRKNLVTDSLRVFFHHKRAPLNQIFFQALDTSKLFLKG